VISVTMQTDRYVATKEQIVMRRRVQLAAPQWNPVNIRNVLVKFVISRKAQTKQLAAKIIKPVVQVLELYQQMYYVELVKSHTLLTKINYVNQLYVTTKTTLQLAVELHKRVRNILNKVKVLIVVLVTTQTSILI